ncbi:MAG TPA: hypothetical protein EYP69_02685, partial [Bacteroidales bacterium]|nr:hypothetical protein [Bacteroidales bacterium]
MRELLLLFILFYDMVFSQTDTAIVLPEVNIADKQFQKIFQGVKVVRFDSLYHIASSDLNIGDVLSQKGFSFVKSYGPMQLQTISIGGASAAQTVICWEGIPFNDIMLGSTDLSLVPFSFFNTMTLYQGGTSILSGGNSLGGAVNLVNKPKFKKHMKMQAGINYLSLDNFTYTGGFDYSDSKYFSRTSLSYFAGNNNMYYFKEDKKILLPHADYTGISLITSNAFKLTTNQTIRIDLWYQKYFRNIPPSEYEAMSDAFQFDEQSRGLFLWQRQGKASETEIKSAFFKSFMWYNDSLKDINSRNTTTTFFLQTYNSWRLKKYRKLFVRGEWNYAVAETNNYLGNKYRRTFSIVSGLSQNLLKNRWKNTLSIRWESVSNYLIPPVFSYGTQIMLSPVLTGKVNISKNYKLPSFNDLYWYPMGNKNLKSENGWSYQGGFQYTFSRKKWLTKFETMGFYNHIFDMIVWKPQTATYWSPVNIGKVKTYGNILDCSFVYRHKIWFVRIDADYTYTETKNDDEDDINYGNELIYVPKNKANINIFFSYGSFL